MTCFKYLFFNICLRWAGPRPHIPFPSRPHFVCKFSRHGDNLSVLRPGSPSITVLVFPDFADAYSRTTASYRLTQLQAKYQRVVSFWVPVNCPSLNELVPMPELRCIPTQFRLPPNLCLCKLPSCNDSALS
jgi:hypothetical protein